MEKQPRFFDIETIVSIITKKPYEHRDKIEKDMQTIIDSPKSIMKPYLDDAYFACQVAISLTSQKGYQAILDFDKQKPAGDYTISSEDKRRIMNYFEVKFGKVFINEVPNSLKEEITNAIQNGRKIDWKAIELTPPVITKRHPLHRDPAPTTPEM